MSTRGCYVFQDKGENEGHVVYKHHDNYPSGAVEFIAKARAHAWPLPRFEADEFAASFIVANKDGPGGVRCVGFGEWTDLAPPDIEYVYVVREDVVSAFAVSCEWGKAEWKSELLFGYPLATIENVPQSLIDPR